MMTAQRNHSKGVALIQVLLVSMILSLLAIYIAKTANWQVSSAQSISDKVRAQMRVESVFSEVFFTLATEAPELLRQGDYNFHGDVFELGGARVEIQDLNGLLSLPLQNQPEPIKRLLLAEGASNDVAEKIARGIISEMRPSQAIADTPAARPLLFKAELLALFPEHADLIETLNRDITFQLTTAINPFTATKAMLTMLTNPSLAEQIVALRNNKELTDAELKRQTGLYPDERISYSMGPGYRIRVTAEVGDAFVRNQRTIWINADDERHPIQIMENRPDY